MAYRTVKEVSDDVKKEAARLLAARNIQEQEALMKVLKGLCAEMGHPTVLY